MGTGRVWFLVGAAIALLPTSSSSSQEAKSEQYVGDSATPSRVVLDGVRLCVRTGYWTPSNTAVDCDGNAINPAPAPAAAPQPPPARAEAPAPPQVASAPPPSLTPERQIAQLNTAALPQAIHFSSDAFFDFDETALKPRGRDLLDKLVAHLADVKYGTIQVVGHTDRIGTVQYNQELSERRANAVRNYLVRADISRDNIRAVGKGKAEPVTEPTGCKGPVSPQVVACLQPDRRVDIEVSGTRQ